MTHDTLAAPIARNEIDKFEEISLFELTLSVETSQ